MPEERMEGNEIYRVTISAKPKGSPLLVLYNDITTMEGLIDIACDWRRATGLAEFDSKLLGEPDGLEMLVFPQSEIEEWGKSVFSVPAFDSKGSTQKWPDLFPTSKYGVICVGGPLRHRTCGKQGYLGEDEYRREAKRARLTGRWSCPSCGGHAVFDADRLMGKYPPLESDA